MGGMSREPRPPCQDFDIERYGGGDDSSGMTLCVWCSRETAFATTVNGVSYHWICLKRRAAARRERLRAPRESARAIRERTARMLQELRQTP
jgi:hypothetical protein